MRTVRPFWQKFWHSISESMVWLVERLARVDVRSGEAIIIWAGLGNGIQALSEQQGRSLSPFLFSSIGYLSFNPRWWALVLIVVGLTQVLVFVPALWGDRFRLARALSMLVAGVLLLVVTGAVLTSGYPPVVTWRYALPSLANFTFAYILWLRYDVQREYEKRLLAAAGEERRQAKQVKSATLPVRDPERVLLSGKGDDHTRTR